MFVYKAQTIETSSNYGNLDYLTTFRINLLKPSSLEVHSYEAGFYLIKTVLRSL